MNELIKIEEAVISNEKVNAVSARELHKLLGVRSHYKDWIRNRLIKYDFQEGVDFFDPDGVTYVISDKNYTSTKYSIDTTIPQIVGRLRIVNITPVSLLSTTGMRCRTQCHLESSLTSLIRMS